MIAEHRLLHDCQICKFVNLMLPHIRYLGSIDRREVLHELDLHVAPSIGASRSELCLLAILVVSSSPRRRCRLYLYMPQRFY